MTRWPKKSGRPGTAAGDVDVLGAVGRLAVRRKGAVLAISAIFVAATQALGLGVVDRLSTGGFEAPGSESSRAAAELHARFDVGQPDLVLLVTPTGRSVDDPAIVTAGQRLTDELAGEPGVKEAFSYWSTAGAQALRSRDGEQALVVARLVGDQAEKSRLAEDLGSRYRAADDRWDVRVGGFQEVFRQIMTQTEHDLVRLERLAAPILLVLLLIVFRSVVAALLPLVVGAVAVAGTMAVLRIIASATEVSVFALNLTTTLGLGLAIDYSLFVVSRFREEVADGSGVDDAVVRSVQTAGRTVAFSALTVAAALGSLLVFPLPVMRSFAYAGIPVVLLAAAGAIVTLPALLAVTGTKLERWAVRRPGRRAVGDGAWHRVAVAVMRRPVPVALVVTSFLLLLAVPFLRIELGSPDDRVLPADAPVRAVHDALRQNFDGAEAAPLLIVGSGLASPEERRSDIDRYASSLSALPGVLRVDAETGSYASGARLFHLEEFSQRFRRPSATYLSVVADVDPTSVRAQHLVAEVRAVDAPFAAMVGGRAAGLVDNKAALLDRLPAALVIIGLITFLVLFAAFGSVLVPVKAVLLNLLSLTATFGAIVWVFQDGHLSSWLGFTPQESIDMGTPIMMFAIAFGLSMDYEVFLLSRIKEEYDRCGDNARAVAVGLERTGSLITAAAVLIAVVFLVSSLSGVTIMKIFGLGLALAVLVDATLVRATLVPAFMRLAGDANWWAPRFLTRLHRRFGFRHDAVLSPPIAVVSDQRGAP